jgi:sugar phosphate permease
MLREFVTRPSIIYSFFGMTAVVFVTTALITWLSTYFQNVQGMPMDKAGGKASIVMVLALIGAPLGGYLTDAWRKKQANARLLLPALSTLGAAILLFASSYGDYDLVFYFRSGCCYAGCYSPGIESNILCYCSADTKPAGLFDGPDDCWENI